jgi:lipopolysaccharide/colanic/teichoic acid biosynthesis glycosyltransferase
VLARLAKRALDVTVAGAGLVAAAPLMGVIAAAIRLDSPGGAIFRQDRVGKDGRVFSILKFRTMQAAAPIRFNPDGSTRVEAVDPRVTRVGKHLRGALDELPQLWNVLRGDMSLVGPRPDMPIHAAAYTDAERKKLRALPGLTSLAVVLGRNEIPWKRRIAIDLAYLEHWSLALDLKILAQTALLAVGLRPWDFAEVLSLKETA